ncbi:MAG: single-stranded DNA-binding protein [Spirochaetales bacterium]|nr:single-stranded DNA-binding protein [Spirochaetales bacterium]
MADVNSVILVGRLTRDAALKFTNTGLAICEFALALNRRVKSGDRWTDEAHFFDVTLFGKQGEAVSQYLTKGTQVAIQGELRQDRWEQDGQKRSKIKIVANNLQLLGGRPQGDGGERFSRSSPPAGEVSGGDEGYSPQSSPESFEDDIPF